MRASSEPMRLLVVDDNPAIHADIKKILDASDDVALADLEAELFGDPAASAGEPAFSIDSAFQGRDALAAVERAVAEGRPYAVAIVDMRMPPGWDGVETIERLWKVDRDVQVVICTAYSDHSWNDIVTRLGTGDSLLILKKPFDNIEVKQLAHALADKWLLGREVTRHIAELESRVRHEVAERMLAEHKLRQAQKLEAIGQLAAGVAHEINTPAQFVGDSIQFLRDATADLLGVVANPASAVDPEELGYLTVAVPEALDRCADGMRRITAIVQSMRQFTHPDSPNMRLVDINHAIENALTLATNEYKIVADVETRFGDLPPVLCHRGDITRAVLNIVVNAAHAIGDVVKGTARKGRITVSTCCDGDRVTISIADTGPGIPEAIRDRVFDPFFTTKEVGKGTGQGLYICRGVVVDTHRGQLRFETEVGKGTTFVIELPIGATCSAAA